MEGRGELLGCLGPCLWGREGAWGCDELSVRAPELAQPNLADRLPGLGSQRHLHGLSTLSCSSNSRSSVEYSVSKATSAAPPCRWNGGKQGLI